MREAPKSPSNRLQSSRFDALGVDLGVSKNAADAKPFNSVTFSLFLDSW